MKLLLFLWTKINFNNKYFKNLKDINYHAIKIQPIIQKKWDHDILYGHFYYNTITTSFKSNVLLSLIWNWRKKIFQWPLVNSSGTKTLGTGKEKRGDRGPPLLTIEMTGPISSGCWWRCWLCGSLQDTWSVLHLVNKCNQTSQDL
jgi:hypothetical protein